MSKRSVNLLQLRSSTEESLAFDSKELLELLRKNGVVPFDLGKRFRLMGFRTLDELAKKYTYLKNTSNDRLSYALSDNVDVDYSSISPSKEQPMFFLSSWVESLLEHNKDAIEFYYRNYLLDNLNEAVKIDAERRVKLGDDESTYVQFYDLVAYKDFSGNKRKLNDLVYFKMMHHVSQHGVRDFLLNIETFRADYDNATFTTAVKAMLVWCIRFEQNSSDTLAKFLLLECLNGLCKFEMSAEISNLNEDYLCISRLIETSFFGESYEPFNVSANKLAEFYTGVYSDFLILIGSNF